MRGAIEVEDLAKRFGRVQAVDGVGFVVPEGAVLGVLGPNGAGKTTTLSLVSGLSWPDRGRVRVAGRPISPVRPPRGQLAALPQDSGLPPERRVREELVWLARLRGFDGRAARARADRALEHTGLADRAEHRIGRLSHGQRRRVGIAQALLGDEPVVLLDEPTSGVDPRSALEIRRDLVALTAGRTVVWSSHDLAEVEELCTHVLILDRGRVVASAPMEELRRATSILRLELAPGRGEPGSLDAWLGALADVDRVEIDPSGVRVTLHCNPTASLDEVTLRVSEILVNRGVVIRGLSRGERLAERFWDATRPR